VAVSTSFPMLGRRVRFAGDTDVGMKRQHNEDRLHLPSEERLTIVADGMGGHASGEVASELAVTTLVEYFEETRDDYQITWPYKLEHGDKQDKNRLVTSIKLANLRIFEAAQREAQYRGMGTTIVAALFLDDGLIIGHVGDSRAYRIRGDRIEQITDDHSLLNDYVKMKKLTPEEIENFPHKNVIVRALGMRETVMVDLHDERPRIGDIYILCSDGLSGMIDDPALHDIVTGEHDLDRAVDRLVEAANGAGGNDNISVVLARIEEL
jgi:protein phosphatase